MQALSGAGYPGVPSLDILDNVVPYIGGKKGKLRLNRRRFWGRLTTTGLFSRT
jgi:aspartate-semialdehyde dehydrogenase